MKAGSVIAFRGNRRGYPPAQLGDFSVSCKGIYMNRKQIGSAIVTLALALTFGGGVVAANAATV